MSWDYRGSIRHVMEALDIRLTEIPDWTCCGATAARSLDEHMAVILPARNLARAANFGLDPAVACPMYFRRLSRTREVLLHERADIAWSIPKAPVVLDLARTLAEPPFLDRIRRIARGALEGLRVVCYYGCQVVRPPGSRDMQTTKTPGTWTSLRPPREPTLSTDPSRPPAAERGSESPRRKSASP